MITVLGNVNNAGYALPMVQAYPLDPNLQSLLAWNPTQQALDYVPYTGNVLGDFGVARDLAVTRNAAVGGTLTVTGKTALTGGMDSLTVNNAVPASGTITATGNISGSGLSAVSGGNNSQLQPTKLQIQAVDVVGTRKTGWVAMTGTPVKATRATGTVTLVDLAGIVMALQADLISHGMIGA